MDSSGPDRTDTNHAVDCQGLMFQELESGPLWTCGGHASDGHQVRVRQVRVGVDREGDLPGAGQELVVEVLPGDADAVSVVRGKVAEISPVGHSPVRVLHVVTVTIVGSVLPGLQIVRSEKYYFTEKYLVLPDRESPP